MIRSSRMRRLAVVLAAVAVGVLWGPPAASADYSGSVITDIQVVWEERCSPGYELDETNANDNVPGATEINLCWKREPISTAQNPITRVSVWSTEDYVGKPCGEDWTWLDLDLNATAEGKYIYVCFQREPATWPVTDADVVSNEGADFACQDEKGSGWDTAGDTSTGGSLFGVDLNESVSSFPNLHAYIHLCTRTLADEDGGELLCGGEGEQACSVDSEFFRENGTGQCDRGLEIDTVPHPDMCVSGRRQDKESRDARDAEGWALWALRNQLRDLQADVPIGGVSFLSAHNAFNNVKDKYSITNQRYSITTLLQAGIRVIDLDVHGEVGGVKQSPVKLCHGPEGGHLCALTDRFFYNAIKEIRAWMLTHPSHPVIIVLEVYGLNDEQRNEVNGYISRFLAGPGNPGVFTPADKIAQGGFVSQQKMVDLGKRVMIWAQNDDFNGTWAFRKGSGGNSTFTRDGKNDWHTDGDPEQCRVSKEPEFEAPASSMSIYEVYETRIGASHNRIDSETLAAMTLCNFDLIGLDRILKLEDGIAFGDERLAAGVWSWRPGDFGEGGDAAMRWESDGRWSSRSLESEYHALCKTRGASGHTTADWTHSAAAVTWSEAFAACAAIGKDFAVPKNAAQNLAAAQPVKVWLNYNDIDVEGKFRADTPAPNWAPVLDASGTMTLEAIDEDAASGDGTTVADIIASAGGDRITDLNGDPEGIAVVGADPAHGWWQWRAAGFGNWLALGDVSVERARLFAGDVSLRFVPRADYNGTIDPALTFRAWDHRSTEGSMQYADTTTSGGSTAFSTTTESASITVRAINDPPSFTSGPDQTVSEDGGAQTVANWVTDGSVGPAEATTQTLSFAVTTTTGALFSEPPGVSPTGTLTYTPAADANGTATVYIRALDSEGGRSAAQAFEITIAPVNDAPVAPADGTSSLTPMNEDGSGSTPVSDVLGETSGAVSDVDDGAALGIAVTGASAAGGAWQSSIDGGGSWNPLAGVSETQAMLLSKTALVRFVPAPDFNGVVEPGLEYRVWDGTAGIEGGTADTTVNGGNSAFSSATNTASITIKAVNDAPSFAGAADHTVDEDAGPQSVAGWATAISPGPADEGGQKLALTVSAPPEGLFSEAPAVSADGTLSYTTAADAHGSARLTLTAADDGGTANGGEDRTERSFVITVASVNDAPVASGDAYSIDEDTVLAVPAAGVLANDVDVEGDALEAEAVTGPAHGTLELAPTGALTYAPDADYFGPDSFTYRADDGELTSVETTVTIDVAAVDDPPTNDRRPPALVAPGPRTPQELAVACSRSDLALVAVTRSRDRVRFRGVADASDAGERVAIRTLGGRALVASATVRSDGSFQARGALPRIRPVHKTRYYAELGERRSEAIRLSRRITASLSAGASTVTITGRVTPPLDKPARAVVIRGLTSCTEGFDVVARVRPNARGRFRVVLPRPAGPALYRAQTRVRSKVGHALQTFSLMLA